LTFIHFRQGLCSNDVCPGLSRRERRAAAEADKWMPTEADEVAHYGKPDSQDAVGSDAGADDEFELLSDWFTELLLMIDSAGLEFEILVGIILFVLMCVFVWFVSDELPCVCSLWHRRHLSDCAGRHSVAASAPASGQFDADL
jgi:hypothetical protein